MLPRKGGLMRKKNTRKLCFFWFFKCRKGDCDQMSNNYHGIIINASQKDQSVFSNIKIIGKHEVPKLNWILYKVEIDSNNIDKLLLKLQDNMFETKYYFHFYRDNELIIVFKDKVFKAGADKSTWKEAIDHGKLSGIPEKQLDFYPCRIEDEKY